MTDKSRETPSRPKITVFHCTTCLDQPRVADRDDPDRVRFIPLACASMVKDVFLLRAFEAGADAVVVLVCPEGTCRYVEGNLRAKKRVRWTRALLDEIGMDGRRLALYNLTCVTDLPAIIDQTRSLLQQIEKDMKA